MTRHIPPHIYLYSGKVDRSLTGCPMLTPNLTSLPSLSFIQTKSFFAQQECADALENLMMQQQIWRFSLLIIMPLLIVLYCFKQCTASTSMAV